MSLGVQRYTETRQHAGLGGLHAVPLACASVVVTAQVQDAVDDVQEELALDRDAELVRHLTCPIDADVELGAFIVFDARLAKDQGAERRAQPGNR